jgi:hypothetical protein
MKKFSNSILSKLLAGLLIFMVAFYLLFSLFWPGVVMVEEPISDVCGREAAATFICSASHVAALELRFADAAYEPQVHGTLKIFEDGDLLQVLDVAGFTIANGYRGAKMIGKKRYRIEYENNAHLGELLEQGKQYHVELEFSDTIPDAQLLFTGVYYQSPLTRASMRWESRWK